MARKFTDSDAVRSAVPLFVGLVGPSGSGKTYSALRLATGMQRVTGGDIGVIDTEADRALHYADQFKFRHLPFSAPFDPLSYLAAVEHFVAKGVKTIVCDSASHMHEGPGGTLEAHAAELQRLAGDDYQKRNRMTMLAWQKPKAELRRFLNAILQLRVNLLICFRAKPKMQLVRGEDPKPLGFQPIAGDEMFFEMTLSCLLYPSSNGVPSWHPDEMGERAVIKLPGQFRDLFKDRKPLDEATGEALAKWAAGGSAPRTVDDVAERPKAADVDRPTKDEVAALRDQLVANGLTTSDARKAWLKQTLGVAPDPTTLTRAQFTLCMETAEG